MDTSQICSVTAFHIMSEKPFSEQTGRGQTGRGAHGEGSKQGGEYKLEGAGLFSRGSSVATKEHTYFPHKLIHGSFEETENERLSSYAVHEVNEPSQDPPPHVIRWQH